MEEQFRFLRTPEYRTWFENQTEKARVQIDHRLSNIHYLAHFGDRKLVDRQNMEKKTVVGSILDLFPKKTCCFC